MSDYTNLMKEETATSTYIEVIPCVECKHMNVLTKHGVTMQQCSQTGRRVEDQDYCSWAKRKLSK